MEMLHSQDTEQHHTQRAQVRTGYHSILVLQWVSFNRHRHSADAFILQKEGNYVRNIIMEGFHHKDRIHGD